MPQVLSKRGRKIRHHNHHHTHQHFLSPFEVRTGSVQPWFISAGLTLTQKRQTKQPYVTTFGHLPATNQQLQGNAAVRDSSGDFPIEVRPLVDSLAACSQTSDLRAWPRSLQQLIYDTVLVRHLVDSWV